MRKITALLLVLLLCPVMCTAENVYAGTWVPVSVNDLPENDAEMLIPAQWGPMPEYTLSANGKAESVRDKKRILAGLWKDNPENSTVEIEWEDGTTTVLNAEGRFLRGQISTVSGEILDMTFAPKAEEDVPGTWTPLFQTKQDGSYYSPPSGTRTLVLKEGQEGTLIQNRRNGTTAETPVTWNRQGNDIILCTKGKYGNGAENVFPFEYYQLEDGFLKAYSVRDADNVFTVWYSRADQAKMILKDADTVRPLLNTAWELYAQDIRDVKVPLSLIGSRTEEYLTFFTKTNGRLLHIENNEQTTLKHSFRLKDGGLVLTFQGETEITCRYTEDGDLVREVGEGKKLYYRRKLIPEAPGLAEGEEAPIDLVISAPDNPSVRAGKTLQLQAEFRDPDVVNRKKGNSAVTWSVCDPEGNEIQGVTISEKGLLKTKKGLREPVEAVVRVRSVSYGTTAECRIRIEP